MRTALLLLMPLLAACAGSPPSPAPAIEPVVRETRHRDGDDLLTAGLGLAGLRDPAPPAFADPAAPSAIELRRRAIWSNWRGIADLAPGGGLGEVYGRLDPVPGREFHALLTLPGARHPHRVLLQLPDAFDPAARCLLLTAASGSRGIYGAISVAGGWGLPRGCAVVHTDKGAGSGWFDSASGQGARLDGTPGGTGDGLEFAPRELAASPPRVLFKHAHSGDNPEADWGRHLRQAAEFGLQQLSRARPDDPPYTFDNTRVIAVGLSNAGGAVLRAAELDGDWLDGVVAAAPNIAAQTARPLYDIATEAALWMPCALAAAAFDREPLLRPGGAIPPAWTLRCASLREAGLLAADSDADPATQALDHLQRSGWHDGALVSAGLSVGFDLWRAVGAAYAAAYTKTGSGPMPCGYDYALLDAAGARRAPTAAERASWWSDTAGIPPAAGVQLIDGLASGNDPALPGLRCLRALWEQDDLAAQALKTAIAATRAAAPRAGLPVLVMHGRDDGLVPEAHTSAPYVAAARDAGRAIRYWRIEHAQHFDAFLAMPALAARYQPLLPYVWHGLDAMWAHVADAVPLPHDATITPTRRRVVEAGVEPLRIEQLALPTRE